MTDVPPPASGDEPPPNDTRPPSGEQQQPPPPLPPYSPPGSASGSVPPPPPAAPLPPYAPPAPPGPTYPVTPVSSADRVRNAWHQRSQSDYIFDFGTALGWTILTCGLYGVYIVYQLVRRSRDHNLRRIELLDAATTFAWEQAQAKGLADELRPAFERIAQQMGALRSLTVQFRDPTVWAIISLFTRGLVELVLFIILDGDLITHDYAEGAIEHELSAIYTRLGAPVTAPDPGRLKQRHNYVGRIIATVASCGIYWFFWEYDVMTDTNKHFEHNWAWEDSLANSVQQLMVAA